MKLLASENFPLDSVNYLSSKGFDVIAVGREFPGITDFEVMQKAIIDSRTILTFDRDYGELIFKHNLRPLMGVVYFRLNKFESDEPGKLSEKLFQSEQFSPERKLIVVTTDSIRMKSY